jgi:type IV secretory pathway VirB3-like protein
MLRSYVYNNYMTQMVYGITYILHIVIMGLMTFITTWVQSCEEDYTVV